MVNLLIDANVFRAIYEEDIGLASPRPERTGSATPVLDQTARPSKFFIDDGHQIESEWRKQCRNDSEWFEAWVAEQFRVGNIWEVTVEDSHRTKAKKAIAFGFPANSIDIWYIRVAYVSKDVRPNMPIHLVSEDIDFYDPAMKKSKNKINKIQNGSGPVAKHLKRENITVSCISTYLATFP
jgi:hypothetical protein